MIKGILAYQSVRAFLRNHPVRPEITGERNLEFSKWLREYCRPSKTGCRVEGIEIGGMVAFDLDFILYDYRRMMVQFLEVKTRMGEIRYAQSEVLKMMDKIALAGAPLVGIKYLGLHILQLQGLKPTHDEVIYWDGAEIDYRQCWLNINMLNEIGVVL